MGIVVGGAGAFVGGGGGVLFSNASTLFKRSSITEQALKGQNKMMVKESKIRKLFPKLYSNSSNIHIQDFTWSHMGTNFIFSTADTAFYERA